MFYEIHPIAAGVMMVGAIVFTWLIKDTETHRKGAIMISLICLFGILLSVGAAVKTNIEYPIEAKKTIIALNDTKVPNIYFIVPDRMPSIEAMRETGINPDSFVSDMRNMGFYVKENQLSHDPYTVDMKGMKTTRTMRYFASVLNDGIEIPLGSEYTYCRNLIKQPALFDTLHSKGYTIVNIASWFSETKDILTADFNLKYSNTGLLEKVFENELSVAYWSRTAFNMINFRFMQSDASLGSVERGRAAWQAGELNVWSQAVHGQGLFIVAHILMPHEPFVFDSEGGPANTKLSQPDQYQEQTEYALTYLKDIAAGILANDPEAIIIIQSDEGMAYKKPIELNYDLSPTQWNGVLTCWYIPDKNELELSELKHTDILNYLTR